MIVEGKVVVISFYVFQSGVVFFNLGRDGVVLVKGGAVVAHGRLTDHQQFCYNCEPSPSFTKKPVLILWRSGLRGTNLALHL